MALGNVNTLPNDRYLRKEFVESTIMDFMDPLLPWEDMFPHVGVDALSITWFKEQYSRTNDPNKRAPSLRREDGTFPHVKMSGIQEQTAQMMQFAFEMDFDERVRRYETFIDHINRGLKRLAFWVAESINTQVLNTLTNDLSTAQAGDDAILLLNVTAGAGVAWDAAGATPVDNIRDAILLIEDQAGYAYAPTDLFLTPSDYKNLKAYLETGVTFQWVKDPTTGDWNGMVEGMKVHKLKDAGLPNGKGLLMDMNNPAVTIYTSSDPDYSTLGKLNIHTYTSDADHRYHIQVWRDLVPVLKEPKGVLMMYNLQ